MLFFATSPVVAKTAVKPDDSKVNAARQEAELPTAENQGSSDAERELAASIRKAIVARDDLSSYARNVKVIVRDQTVQLVGPVRSVEEKGVIEEIAKGQAGANAVVSELSVAPK
jgi:osmotically-inducible protein OsmY